MRKAIVMAMLACGLEPALVHAQSSVTLYGTLDDSIQYTNNQKGASALSAQAFGPS
jgi:GBP family porin